MKNLALANFIKRATEDILKKVTTTVLLPYSI